MGQKMRLTLLGALRSVAFAFLVAGCSTAAVAKTISDKSKQKQATSMEFGEWNFEPAMYYGLLHPKYSGAKSKFFIFDYSFHEDRSDVKRLMWDRSGNRGLEYLRNAAMKEQLDSLTPIVDEELYQAIDRQVDLQYADYKEEFVRLQGIIEECLTFSLERSNGKYRPIVEEISNHNKIICDKIAYVRKTGPGSEMSNADRQEGYEQALKELRSIANVSLTLLIATNNLFPKK